MDQPDVEDSSVNKNVTIIKVKAATSSTPDTALLHLIPIPPAKPVTAPADPEDAALEGCGDAASVHKNLAIIQEAQNAVRRLDLLVCGKCHKTFHFIEEFTEHKSDDACLKPAYRTNINESKPQVWAFLLWKANVGARLMSTEPDATSWGLYKRWCKLSQSERDTWIAAGKAIQVCTTLGAATIRQVTTDQKKQMTEGDHLLFSDTIRQDKVSPPPPPPTVVKRKVGRPRTVGVERADDEVTTKLTPRPSRGPTITPAKHTVGMKPKAMRTRLARVRKAGEEEGETSEEENYTVEKILAKRLNPKTKQYEYLLKWEGYPQDQNTWEPVDHMEACDKLVETFERNLAKQKANQAKVGSAKALQHKVVTKVVKLPAKVDISQPGTSGESGGRPIRSSKMRAMENVKSWCGSIGKRKGADESDSDVETEAPKRVKLEYNSSSADENEESKTPGLLKSLSLVKSPTQKVLQPVNGSSPPVLVANAKGVIKVDSKQVNNLTSGVYIVSNQSGVVKLGAGGSPKKTSDEQPSSLPRLLPRPSPGGLPRLLPKGSPKASGLIKVGGPQALHKRALAPRIPVVGSPRIPSPRLLGARPSLATLAARPGLRPPFVPRPPSVLRPPLPRGPAAQVKSGLRPIQAMLGTDTAPASFITVQVPKKKTTDSGRTKPGPRNKTLAPQVETGGNAGHKPTGLLTLDLQEVQSESEEERAPSADECLLPSPPCSPLPLTLCPETGKILGQAEGEPEPQASPEDNVVQGGEDITVTRLAEHMQTGEVLESGAEGSGEYVTITGEDGVVYHIATDGESLVDGETMLMTDEGHQQCVYVTQDSAPTSGSLLTLDSAVAEAVALMGEGGQGTQIVMAGEGAGQIILSSGGDGETSTQAQVVAQIVEEGDLPPGGMRKVVLLLPDGNFMMTEVDEEQYAALDLGK